MGPRSTYPGSAVPNTDHGFPEPSKFHGNPMISDFSDFEKIEIWVYFSILGVLGWFQIDGACKNNAG